MELYMNRMEEKILSVLFNGAERDKISISPMPGCHTEEPESMRVRGGKVS
jgi:hypothetical protein